MQVQNFYNKIKKADDGLRHYPNESKMNIELPFRALFVGPSGSGKTNVVLNWIALIGVFDKVVLLAKDLEEPLYQWLIETFTKIEKKNKCKILLAITTTKDLPAMDDFNPKENTLLICDDFITDKASFPKLEEIFIRGRKRGISSLFLSQSYFATPLMIRKNVDYVVFKKLGTVKDLTRILGEYSGLDVTVDELRRMYCRAVEGDFTNFFMINVTAKKRSLMFRKNFDPIVAENEDED